MSSIIPSLCVGYSGMFNQALGIAVISLLALHAFSEADPSITMSPPTEQTTIDIGVELIQVEEIDRASKEVPQVTARFRLKLKWLDGRLSQRLKNYDKITTYQDEEATKKLSTIFDPKIGIRNGTTELEHQILTIHNNGLVNLIKVIKVVIPADFDLRRYPFDSQTFRFEFASPYFNTDQMDLNINQGASKLFDDAAPRAWNFDYSNAYISKQEMVISTNRYSTFNFVVHAQRDPRSFLWRLLIPLLVIVVLSWNVFWLYEDAQAALEICFLFLLTVVAFHQIANEMLPMVPFFTFMDALVFISYGFIIIPVFQIIITARLEKKGYEITAEYIRKTCQWAVPLIFVTTILFSTILYFV